MKKRGLIALGLALTLFFGVALWWIIPVEFLQGITVEEIGNISVLDGTTGKKFLISDWDDIEEVLFRIQGEKFTKRELAGSRTGFDYILTIFAQDGAKMDELVIYSKNSICRGSFLYRGDISTLSPEILKRLEENAS